MRQLQRQASLATAARTGKGQQSRVPVTQQRPKLIQLDFPTDQQGQMSWEVVHTACLPTRSSYRQTLRLGNRKALSTLSPSAPYQGSV
jgi:hypothetical protein